MLLPIFKSQGLQKRFEKDGFVVIRKLIPPEVVGSLRDLYFRYQSEHYGDRLGMHSSAHTGNAEMLSDISSTIIEKAGSYADKYLCNCNFYFGNFLVKESREDSSVGMHQDWTCVDEPDHCSLNFWMDLEGTDHRNGHLFFLKGSHRLRQNLRFAPECPSPWDDIRSVAPSFYTYVNTSPGDVVCINNACLHGSTVNRSGRSRIAAIMSVHSKNTDLLQYYLEPGKPLDKIEKYIVSTKSLINMPRGGRPPESKFCGYVSYKSTDVTESEFMRFMLGQYSVPEKISYYIKRSFGRQIQAT